MPEQMGSIELFKMHGDVSIKGGPETNKELDAIDKKASVVSNSFTKAGEGFKKLGVTFESVGRQISSAGKLLSVALTAPILAGAGAGLKFNAQMEDFTANFETMLGSADKAKSMIADLTDFAKKTPFEMAGLADSAKVLLNFGIESKDVIKTIGMLGDVSMGNQEKLNRITLAFGQIQSTGRLMGQDLLQLINSGFNPLQVISEKTGRSMADLKEDMEKGAISADMVTDAFKTATSEGGLFFGAMEKGSKTFNGQLSTLKDTVNITFGEIMKPLFKEISENWMPKLIAGAEKVGKWFSALSEEQKLNILKWAGILAAIGPVLLVFGKLIAAIPVLVTGIKAIGVAFTFLAANPIILVLTGVVAVLALLVYQAGAASREIHKMTDSIIADYRREADAKKALVDKEYAAQVASLDRRLEAEDKASVERRKVIQDEYDAAVKGAGKVEKQLKKNLDDRMQALEDSHKKIIDQINEEYGIYEDKHKSRLQALQDELNKKTSLINEISELSADAAVQEGDLFEKTYIAIIEKAKEVHNEKLLMYEEEYLASIGLINADLAAKIKGYKDEIAGIEGKTKEEERIAKEQDDAQRILDLQKKLDDAKDDQERKTANEDLLAEINRQTREKLLQQRSDRVTELNKQIEDAIKAANEEKGKLLTVLQKKLTGEQAEIKKDIDIRIAENERERAAKVLAETSKYNAMKESLNKQLEAMDDWMPKYQAKLDAEYKAKLEAEQKKLAAAKAAIEAEQALLNKQITAEKTAIEKEYARNVAFAKIKELQQEIDLIREQDTYMFGAFSVAANEKKIADLNRQIAALYEQATGRRIPSGYAKGTDYVPLSGTYTVGEQGPEQVFLPQGAAVSPTVPGPSVTFVLNNPKIFNERDARDLANLLVSHFKLAGVKL